MPIENLMLIGSILVLISIAIMMFFENLGLPALILFLAVGMLAGSEGLGGIYFDNYGVARAIGVAALVVILFSGGLDTDWGRSRPVLGKAASLATLGVLLTAAFVGLFAHYALGFELIPSLLLGAIISSTDAAAVFSILRIRRMGLPRHLSSLVELESGTNDPMAVFLTVGLIQLMQNGSAAPLDMLLLFVRQMGLGALAGFAFGKALVFLLNRMRYPTEGIAYVFTLAFAALAFSSTDRMGGSGFLAIYMVGIIAGNSNVKYKRSLLRFWDGLAWISQISMFLILGLLVFPSHLAPVAGAGILLSLFLMLVARPAAVFLSLSFTKMRLAEKSFLSWVGLRGAVPIILATFPLMAGIPQAELIFNLVFFIVLTSALLQGWSIPLAGRIFRVSGPEEKRYRSPVDVTQTDGLQAETIDIVLPFRSAHAGRSLVQLNLPSGTAVVLISRGDEFLIPHGSTVLEEMDAITLLVQSHEIEKAREIFSQLKPDEGQ